MLPSSKSLQNREKSKVKHITPKKNPSADFNRTLQPPGPQAANIMDSTLHFFNFGGLLPPLRSEGLKLVLDYP